VASTPDFAGKESKPGSLLRAGAGFLAALLAFYSLAGCHEPNKTTPPPEDTSIEKIEKNVTTYQLPPKFKYEWNEHTIEFVLQETDSFPVRGAYPPKDELVNKVLEIISQYTDKGKMKFFHYTPTTRPPPELGASGYQSNPWSLGYINLLRFSLNNEKQGKKILDALAEQMPRHPKIGTEVGNNYVVIKQDVFLKGDIFYCMARIIDNKLYVFEVLAPYSDMLDKIIPK